MEPSVSRRLSLRNLAEKGNALALRIPQTEGSGTIDIPLLDHTLTPRNSEQEKDPPKAHEAKTMLVACNLAWNTLPHSQKLNIIAGDYTDLSRFSDSTRSAIYEDLAKRTPDDLKNKPWNKLISNTTTELINHELKLQQQCLNPGWLYIYKDGFLWREIQINAANLLGQNTYQEINLLNYAGTNERKATGQPTPHIILPYKVDGTETKLEIGYSPVQYSWARINYFGGMDPKDPRASRAVASAKAGEGKAKRSERFLKLDLAPFTKPDAKIGKTISGDQDNPSVILINSNMTPTIRMSDPIGLVERFTNDISALRVKLQKLLLSLAEKQGDTYTYFHSALLTYQTFFNDKLAFNQSGMSDQESSTAADIDNANTDNIYAGNDNLAGMQKTADDEAQPTLFKQAQKELDRTKLEKILKVKERASLRALIQQLQAASISIVTAVDNANWYSSPLSFQSLFTDLTSSGDYSYFTALATLSGILNTTTFDPRGIDYNFDVNLDKEPTYIPPGIALAQAIAQQKNQFSKLLFPNSDNEQQFDALIKKDPNAAQHITVEDIIKHDKGDGAFNLSKQMATFNGIKAALQQDQTLGLLSSIVTTLIVILERHDPTPDKQVFSLIRRWLKLSGLKEFAQLDVSHGKLVSHDYSVLGFEYEKVNTFIEEHIEPATNQTPSDSNNKPINLVHDNKNETGHISRKILRRFDAQSIYKNTGARVDTIELKTFSSEEEFHDEVIAKIENPVFSLKKDIINHSIKMLETSNKFIAPILGAFQVVNLRNINEEAELLKNKGSSKVITNGALVAIKDILYITYAIEEVYLAFRNKNDVNKLYAELFSAKSSSTDKFRNFVQKRFFSSLTPLATAGCIASLISMGLAAESFYYDTKNKNYDYLMVDALNFASSGLSLASIGVGYVEAEDAITISTLELASELLGLAGAILGVVAMIIFSQLNQSAIVQWAKKSPFSKSQPSNDNNEITVQKLITLLSSPQPTIKPLTYGGETTKQAVMVEINLPFFEVDKIQLVVQTSWSKDYLGLNSPTTSFDTQQTILPTRIEQLMQDDKITGMRYYYTDLDVGDLRLRRSGIMDTTVTPIIHYRTRVRLATTDGKVRIPYVDDTASKKQNSTNIDSTDKSWIYAES